MSADFARLGAEIRARREALGLSLRALARRVDLSPSTLSLAERGGPVIGCDARGLVLYARRVWLWWVVAKILTGRAWQRVREARR